MLLPKILAKIKCPFGLVFSIRKNVLLLPMLLPIFFSTSAFAGNRHIVEAESAAVIGGTKKISDDSASGKHVVTLRNPGDGLLFPDLPAATTLAIRYATLTTGTFSIAVNNQPPIKINIHSSGSFTESFLHSVITLTIPKNAKLKIYLDSTDVALNIDRIVTGTDNLGLAPDIWNLPPLPVAKGPYSADWKELGRKYAVPEWWRDAKFGVWAHWDPQSMPEQGDWYARGMYIEGSAQYKYHVKHFGYPSEYGYKDIAHNWVIDRWNPEQLMDLYVEMGARYFMAMGAHHDNFDCWDSKYQPWNSVNVGPKSRYCRNLGKNRPEAWFAFWHWFSQYSPANLGTIYAGALYK